MSQYQLAASMFRPSSIRPDVILLGFLFALSPIGLVPNPKARGDEPAATSIGWSVDRAVQVQPSNFILHSVQAKDVADRQRGFLQLRGPKLASVIRTDEEVRGYYAWYQIGNARRRQPTSHQIRLGDSPPVSVELGKAAFLLSPAQAVSDGTPPSLPESVGFLTAFELAETSNESLFQMIVANADQSGIDRVRPTHVAVATDYWHHDDFTPMSDPKLALIVCLSEPIAATGDDAAFTILDSFGINRLVPSSLGPLSIVATLE